MAAAEPAPKRISLTERRRSRAGSLLVPGLERHTGFQRVLNIKLAQQHMIRAAHERKKAASPLRRAVGRLVAWGGVPIKLALAWFVVFVVLLLGAELLRNIEGPLELRKTLEYERLMGELLTAAGSGTLMKENLEPAVRLREHFGLCSLPSSAALRWTFAGSCYYVLTTITTIGYGTFVPSTMDGKLATIVFGIVGLTAFGVANAMMASAVEAYLCAAVERAYFLLTAGRDRTSNPRANEEDDVAIGKLSALACILWLAAWLVAMAGYYACVDGLAFSDALYFAFVTSTTIGLGDFAPGRSRDHVLSYMFVMFGVTMMAVCIASVGRLLGIMQHLAAKIAAEAAAAIAADAAAATSAFGSPFSSHTVRALPTGHGAVHTAKIGVGGEGDEDSDTATLGLFDKRSVNLGYGLLVFSALIVSGGAIFKELEGAAFDDTLKAYADVMAGMCMPASVLSVLGTRPRDCAMAKAQLTNLTRDFYDNGVVAGQTAPCSQNYDMSGHDAEAVCFANCKCFLEFQPGGFCWTSCMHSCMEHRKAVDALGCGLVRTDFVFAPPLTNHTTPPAKIKPKHQIESDEKLDRIHTLLGDLGCSEPDVASTPWTWTGAIMFSLTLVTTIGYGNFSIAKERSRGFLVAYALVGIVLYGWCNVQLVNKIENLKARCKPRSAKDNIITSTPLSMGGRRPNLLRHLCIVALISLLYLVIGAAVMHKEDHDGDNAQDGFGGAIWFAFISCTTIGFGDAVIQTEDKMWFVIGMVYILGGLSLVGIALQSLAETVSYFASEEEALHHVAACIIQQCWKSKLHRARLSRSSMSVHALAPAPCAPKQRPVLSLKLPANGRPLKADQVTSALNSIGDAYPLVLAESTI